MARGQGVFAALGVRGSIGDTFTFANWKGIQVIKKKPFPANPQTAPQTAERNQFSQAVAVWHNPLLDDVDKLAWNLRAQLEALIMTGFNKLVSIVRKQPLTNTWVLLYNVRMVDAAPLVSPRITADVNCNVTMSIVRGPGAGFTDVQACTAGVEQTFANLQINSNSIVLFAADAAGDIGESGFVRAVPIP